MTEDDQNAPNSSEAVEQPLQPAPGADRPHVIRVQHADTGFVGPFSGREQAENYLAAKRAQAGDEDRWAANKVEVIPAEQAHREREDERARELMRR